MPFGAHETVEVHEILNEKMNVITHFSLYAEHAQSPQVRDLIQQQIQIMVQQYDQLVAYTHDYSAANRSTGFSSGTYAMGGISPEQINYGLRQPSPAAPQIQGRLSDGQILNAVLCCHKNSAKNSMHASLECADPNVRQMLLNGAIVANQHAYDTFLLMNQLGQYQVPTMQDHTAKTFLHAFQPMQATAPAPYI
ncbi:spore coat protein [Paenibacillus sedimenti]|uniref:Spore coat protein n=1 Tax=Paenibacillus sedimenti TaxID=2770274 RepID=A0A926KRX0_9BACL|nr:spore coat protein [Paenibacillus sedimenti]MBD0381158.1 spore coat protein [Paenibacillus sedimenti]